MAMGPLLGPMIKQEIYETKLGRYDANEAALRQPESTGLTAAAVKQMEAQQRIMQQSVGSAIEQARVSAGQRGMYTSGEMLTKEEDIRQRGMTGLSSALANIGLQSEGLKQQGQYMDIQTAMQETQMMIQKQQQEAAMIEQTVSTMLPMLMQRFGQQASTPEMSMDQPLDDLLGLNQSGYANQFGYNNYSTPKQGYANQFGYNNYSTPGQGYANQFGY
jgi:hypothetical protein